MKNEYYVTKKIYRSWVIENMLKKPGIIFRILWCMLAIFILIISESNLVYVMLGVFCLYRAFLRNIVRAEREFRMMIKVYGSDKWKRTIVFGDENITVDDGRVCIKYLYSNIVDIQENKNKIRLISNDNTIIRLYKNAFINCSWEACKEKIKDKQQNDV